MAGTELAEKVVPILIGKMLPDLKDVTGLADVICSNILDYGYQNKKL